jgi:hypothetical protein
MPSRSTTSSTLKDSILLRCVLALLLLKELNSKFKLKRLMFTRLLKNMEVWKLAKRMELEAISSLS